MKTTATIYDVAKRAQVGIATVSRVLNNSGHISPTTRDKVLRIIDELNYKPNPSAQKLARQKSDSSVWGSHVKNDFLRSIR